MISRIINEQERQKYIDIAHELRYPKEIIDRIISAKTVLEAERAMTTGRQNETRREEILFGYSHNPKTIFCQ